MLVIHQCAFHQGSRKEGEGNRAQANVGAGAGTGTTVFWRRFCLPGYRQLLQARTGCNAGH